MNAWKDGNPGPRPKRVIRRGLFGTGTLVLLGLACTWAVRALALGLPDQAAEAPGGRSTASRGESVSGPGQDMIRTLSASGPHPSYGAEAKLFDQFVGTWDCEYTLLPPGGAPIRQEGQVTFGWILDGWAVQDIWWSRPAGNPGAERAIGTTLRFFDAKKRVWRVIWVAPRVGAVIQLEGGLEDNRIVLRGTDADGSLTRWSFNDIAADRFTWYGENSSDGGKTWVRLQESRMRRRR